jgi:TRAP-type C4-dicarboxylate transport system permease small subunit
MISLFKSGKISLGLQLQLGYIYLAIPAGYLLMTLRLSGRLIDNIKNYKGGKTW